MRAPRRTGASDGRIRWGSALSGLLAALALCAFAPSASASETFCPFGTGAGQCNQTFGVAVNQKTGDVYSIDRLNNRVNVFDSSGKFRFAWGWGVADGVTAALQRCGPQAAPPTASCFAGIEGVGAGQFTEPTRIAIDNSGGPSNGAVYVGTDSFRVQKFDSTGHFLLSFGSKGTGDGQLSGRGDPLAVGADGSVYACDSPLKGSNDSEGALTRVEKFEPSGVFVESVPLATTRFCQALVVDSSGNFYTTFSLSSEGVDRFDPSGNLLSNIDPGTGAYALAIDSADHLFVAQSPPLYSVVTEYDSSGAKLFRFGYEEIPNLSWGLAIQNSTGTLFGASGSAEIVRLTKPALGPIVVPKSVLANPIGNAKATLNAKVNPEGKATTYHFDYITEASYEADGDSFGAGTLSTLESASIGSDFEVHPASAVIGCPNPLVEAGEPDSKCLVPESRYRFRIVAKDSEGHERILEGTPFETLPPLQILSTFATEASPDSVKLHAEVNPLGIPTTGRFEYVPEAQYEESGFAGAATTGELDFGSGEARVERSALVSELVPGTAYRYRVLVEDPLIAEPLAGPTLGFTTQAPPLPGSGSCPNATFRSGASANLPECRAYEMVSPVEKGGSDIAPAINIASYLAELDQAAAAGGKLTYSTSQAFADPEGAPYSSQYVATRDPGAGWQSDNISPPHGNKILGVGNSLDVEFKAFSPDLCEGWLARDSDPVLAPGAVEGFTNLYKADLCGDGGYEVLTTVEPPTREPARFLFELQDVSGDGEMALYRANDALSEGAPAVGETQYLLYAVREGSGPRLICILPSGAPTNSGGCSLGTGDLFIDGRRNSVTRAVSGDGSRVYWSDSGGRFYLRANPFAPESAHLHGAAIGKGDLAGPPLGKGAMTSGSKSITGFTTLAGSFAVGQEVTAANGGLPAGTTITKIQPSSPTTSTLTISNAATVTESGAQILGPGSAIVSNVAANSGAFAVGQEITSPGGGIPLGTTIVKVEGPTGGVFKLTLSAKATKIEAGAALYATSECTESVAKACTIAISDLIGGKPAQFWAGAEDGSKAIVTAGEDLYEFTAEAAGSKLVPQVHLIAKLSKGVLGASEDASRVYFVSKEALSNQPNGEGEVVAAGKPNLYLYEAGEGGGTYTFIAELGAEDAMPEFSPVSPLPREHQARVSPDGRHLIFMSSAALLGYDNTDALSGEADQEIYTYEAGGELFCVSCNPTGARPVGRELIDGKFKWSREIWAAAQIPLLQSQTYAPRALAPDGSRIFFDSTDALVARDTNGRQDVYEWQRAQSTEECEARGAELHVPRAGGCLSLISSGQNRQDSRFIDASEDGTDAFFTTGASLLAQDPGLIDIYDARVEGGFPSPAPPAASCEGEACQSPPEAPNDPTPASASFQGAGNVNEAAPPARKPCAKGKVRRKGKCVVKHAKKTHKQAKHKRRAGR